MKRKGKSVEKREEEEAEEAEGGAKQTSKVCDNQTISTKVQSKTPSMRHQQQSLQTAKQPIANNFFRQTRQPQIQPPMELYVFSTSAASSAALLGACDGKDETRKRKQKQGAAIASRVLCNLVTMPTTANQTAARTLPICGIVFRVFESRVLRTLPRSTKGDVVRQTVVYWVRVAMDHILESS